MVSIKEFGNVFQLWPKFSRTEIPQNDKNLHSLSCLHPAVEPVFLFSIQGGKSHIGKRANKMKSWVGWIVLSTFANQTRRSLIMKFPWRLSSRRSFILRIKFPLGVTNKKFIIFEMNIVFKIFLVWRQQASYKFSAWFLTGRKPKFKNSPLLSLHWIIGLPFFTSASASYNSFLIDLASFEVERLVPDI